MLVYPREGLKHISAIESAGNYTVRRAAEEDAGVIASWFPTHESAVLWGGNDVPKIMTIEWLREQFAKAATRYYVLADVEDRVCGTFSLRRASDDRMHLGRFGIDPALRRRGLGKLMLTKAIGIARQERASTFTLVVYEKNLPARRLYEQCGFSASTMPHKLDAGQMLMELQL